MYLCISHAQSFLENQETYVAIFFLNFVDSKYTGDNFSRILKKRDWKYFFVVLTLSIVHGLVDSPRL